MKIKIFIFLAGTILILQSCATSPTTKISAVATMDQKVGYGNTIVSQKKHFVSLTPYTQLDSAIRNIKVAEDKVKFILTVENCGDEFIEFSYKNISAIFVPKSDDAAPQPVPVQPWKEFWEDFKKEYDKNEMHYIYTTLYSFYMKILASSSMGSGGGFMVPGGGGDLGAGEGGGSGGGGELDDLVYEIESMRDQKDVLEQMLPPVLIKQGRILPGKSYSGVLIFDTGNLDSAVEGNFRIAMTIDGEEYRFIFRRGISR